MGVDRHRANEQFGPYLITRQTKNRERCHTRLAWRQIVHDPDRSPRGVSGPRRRETARRGGRILELVDPNSSAAAPKEAG
jgi:hypothetical protein